jgi:ATP-binding protein involved in chromosome partitioning
MVDRLSDAVAAALGQLVSVRRIEVLPRDMTSVERDEVGRRLGAAQARQVARLSDGTTKLVAIASGKGGVGKSTVAVNLACALAAQGKRVGLVDLDVWGYSVPKMLGVSGTPLGFGDVLLPMQAHGLKVASIGLLVEDRTPVVWRGPLLHEAVQHLLTRVYWGDLDVLVADLPPGTGDVPISLASIVRDAVVVIVTTPQETARAVAERAGLMAKTAHLRVAGVIENMAGYECPHCGDRSELFGQGGGEALADLLKVPVLGRIPISVQLRQSCDERQPLVVAAGADAVVEEFIAIAARLDRSTRDMVRRHLPVTGTGPAIGDGANVRPIFEEVRTR